MSLGASSYVTLEAQLVADGSAHLNCGLVEFTDIYLTGVMWSHIYPAS